MTMVDVWPRMPRLNWGTFTPDQLANARSATNNGGMFGSLEDSGQMRFDAPSHPAITPLGSWGGDPWGGVGLSGGATTNTTGLNNGGQQGSPYYRVNAPSGYGKPNAYYYNGHAAEGDQGQWLTLPVAYNEAADTKRWQYNGTDQESTMRRAMRYAFDDMRDGRATDFNQALMARLTQFYNEAGGQGVGYTLPGQAQTDTLGNPNGGGWPNGGAGQSMRGLGYTPPPSYQRDNGQEGAGVSAGGNASEPWTYQKQAQEGSDVSMPGYDPGQGGGGTMPGQQPGGQGSTDYNALLGGNKAVRVAALLDRLGLGSPMAQHSLAGSTMANMYTNFFDPWRAALGVPGTNNIADNESGLIDRFATMMRGPGGFGKMAGDAQTGINAITSGNASEAYKHLDAPDLFDLLQGLNQLFNSQYGAPFQQARNNQMQDAFGDYSTQTARAAQAGDTTKMFQGLLPFLQSNPIYGFMTGQQR